MNESVYLDPSTYLESLRGERGRLAALADADLTQTVTPCPEWTIDDLLIHVGRVHRWAMDALEAPPDSAWPKMAPRPERGADTLGWVLDGLGELVDKLTAVGPDRPCFSFGADKTARFWYRRQALETALHRWDAQVTLGDADAIPAELAASGVDEWCEVQRLRWYRPSPDVVGSVHLHATDGEGEWLIETTPDGFQSSIGHKKGDAAIRGSRSDLYLVLWNRRPLTAVETFGDTDLIAGLLTNATVG